MAESTYLGACVIIPCMHNIEMHEASDEFAKCWQAAGQHLSNRGDGRVNWLKADLIPPFLEHLSFRLGNQLFYVRLVDVDGRLQTPGNLSGLQAVADGCRGFACLMPMKWEQGQWTPAEPDWGLVDLRSGSPIDPVIHVSDEPIEMTQWELLDFAVQIVRNHITDDLKRSLMSSQSNPAVHPSIWFVGDEGPEWVAVQMATYGSVEFFPSCDLNTVARSCADRSAFGHVAKVGLFHADQGFDDNSLALPMLRGHGAMIRFNGLEFLPIGD